MACCVVHRLAAPLCDPAAKCAVIDRYQPYWGIGKRLRAIVTAALVTQLQSERYYSALVQG